MQSRHRPLPGESRGRSAIHSTEGVPFDFDVEEVELEELEEYDDDPQIAE
jgi:hypothetical protein